MNFIYLHGFCSGENSFKGSYFRKKFAEKGIRLHTPDLNGGDFEHLTITGQLKIVKELADSLNGDITLLGSSMGGYLSTLFAEENQRAKQLILIAPAFQFVSRYLNRMENQVLRQWKKTGYLEVYHYAYKANRRLHYGIIEDAQHYDRINLHRKLPAMIFHGIHDDSVNYRQSINYLENNPLAQVLLLNADHQMKSCVETIWNYTRYFLDI